MTLQPPTECSDVGRPAEPTPGVLARTGYVPRGRVPDGPERVDMLAAACPTHQERA
jgi:hypothetical protein